MCKLETRTLSCALETREDNGEGIIEGRPIVYDTLADLGLFYEKIASGALGTTDLTDVRFCLNHDTSFVYARSRRNNPQSTMQLFPDELGLGILARLAIEKSPKARDLYSAIIREDINKMSFMFTVEDEEWLNLESDKPTRIIKSIGTVVEVSAVTFPAYDTTEIFARNKEALDSARSALEKARQLRAAEVDTSAKEIDFLKQKIEFLRRF